ncbi:MAG: hypothetical protein KGZ93_03195 [Actinobacteria bacterium]|nr:hypothetical protein [Actinomycetota bacterium]
MFLGVKESPVLGKELSEWPLALLDNIVPDVKVVYSDVDGTLFGPGGCLFKNEDHEYTAAAAQAILACHLHRIDVVLVSGRNRHQLHGDARILGFQNWIAELGCQLVYGMGETVVLNAGDFRTEGKTVWEAIEAGGAPALLLESYAGLLEYHLPWSQNRECTHIFRGRIDTEEANELLAREGFADVKIIDNGEVRRRSERLRADIPEIHAYHLLPAASGKASAVRKDRELRAIPKETTIAIGDSASDLALAPEVGALFLVKNAITKNSGLLDAVKNYPNVFVTNHAMGAGWAEAIHYLIGRKYV